MCNAYNCPVLIKQKIKGKRKLHTDWHQFWTLESKRLLNTATQELKELLIDNINGCIQTFLQGHAPTESTDRLKKHLYPLDLTRNLGKKQLGKVFQPHPSENEPEEEETLIKLKS
jgi:hypothetical protein